MNSAREVSAVADKIIAVVNARDWGALEALTTPKVLVTLPDGTTADDYGTLVAMLDRTFTGKKAIIKSLELLPLRGDRVTPVSDGLEVMRSGVIANAELPFGRSWSLEAAWTGTFVRVASGEWRLAALHASAPVFDNAVIKREAAFGVCAALIVGVVASFLGFKLWGRSGS